MPQPQEQEHQKLAAGLEGKYVDEFGNILDWDGTVLGRVQGDLPSMVGRPVTADGQVLDEDGEVAGYVCDNYIEPPAEPEPKLKPLASGGLKVDDEGNIYDDQGNKIGKLDKPIKDGADKVSGSNNSITPRGNHGTGDQKQGQGQGQQGQGGGSTGTTNTNNAPGGAPKPPRPDELFLDVKSTYDGIQLTIKIPTVFNSTMMRETKSSGCQTAETAAPDVSSDNR